MAGLEGYPKPGGKLGGETRRALEFQGGVVDSLGFAFFFDLDHYFGKTLNPYEFFSLTLEAVEKFHKTGIRIAGHE
jgi:hypothetical protein